MTTAAIRTKLINYVTGADENTIKALYTILESDMENKSYQLTDEQMQIVEERRSAYLKDGKSYSWAEVHENIRKKRKNA